MGQYCFARWRLSATVVVCNAAGGRAAGPAAGRAGGRAADTARLLSLKVKVTDQSSRSHEENKSAATARMAMLWLKSRPELETANKYQPAENFLVEPSTRSAKLLLNCSLWPR